MPTELRDEAADRASDATDRGIGRLDSEGSSRATRPTARNDPLGSLRWRLGTVESRWLILLIATFAVSLTALCDFRFHELYATTWDFGIYQQAIYSTAHGRPFYESADLATGGYGSFLQVHSALTLYAVVPLYAAYPDPVTLFAVQSVVVGAAAVPLYLLAIAVGVSPRRSLGLAGLFLVAAPTVASTMYDFHAEAFVPLVYLTVAWLWQTKRYGWGAVAVGIGFLTMEVVPVLLFFLAVFFLSQRVRPRGAEGIVARDAGESVWARLRALVLDPEARPTWLLLAASFVAYYLLLALRYHWFSDWFGFPPFPSVPRGYVVGATPTELGLSLSNVVIGLYGKATYWIVLLVLVGGLPLWAPRTWILSAPWIAFTFLTADPNYSILGFQYGFIAGAPLFASAAYALPHVRLPWATAALPSRPGATARWRRGRLAHELTPVRAAVLGLIVLNVVISPLDPYLSNAAPGAAYDIVYAQPVPLTGALALAGLVPAGATIVASNDLFPLVANNLNAYSLFWGPNPRLDLPFDLTHLPQYAFLSQDRLDAVPPWLSDSVYVPNEFGLRGVAWTSPAGTILLFERGYVGLTEFWGPTPATALSVPPTALSLTGSAKIVDGTANASGPVAESVSGATGQLWSSPGLSLAAGNYSLTLWLRASVPDGNAAPSGSDRVFGADGSPFAQPNLFALSATWSSVGSITFVQLTALVHVPTPIVNFTIRGYAYDPAVSIALADITLSPAP